MGRVTGRQGQDCFTRIGEDFNLLRLDPRGKVHTITKAWPVFLLPFNEAVTPPEERQDRSYSTTQVVNPFPRRTSSSAGFVCRCARSQESDRRPTTTV